MSDLPCKSSWSFLLFNCATHLAAGKRRLARAFALSVALLAALMPTAAAAADSTQVAQPYPSKPVRLILGPAPGGPADAITRVIATSLSQVWNQQVVVDNRPGAGNTMAAAIVARSAPDGYTLHRCGSSDSIAPALYRNLSYDYIRDFAAIARIGVTPNILVVHPQVPAKSVTEFIAYAKANPGKLDYAASGVGQSPQLSFELLKIMTGIDVLFVPYKSAALAMTDLLGGRVAAQITNMPLHLDTVRTGKVRALGVTTAKRSPRMPEIPTIAESGVPGFEVTVWYAMCSPAAVQKSIRDKIGTDLLKLLATPELRKHMADLGVEADPLDAAQFTAFLKAETVKWAKVIKEAGIPPQ